VTPRSLILIVRPALTPAFRERFGTEATVEIFSSSESLHALDAIRQGSPSTVVLDPRFALTARGGALVGALKKDSRLQDIELRALIEDERQVLGVLKERLVSTSSVIGACTRPLTRWGPRAAARTPMGPAVSITVNGHRGTLRDLSVTGVQVSVPLSLRPEQTVHVTIVAEAVRIRRPAVVAWVRAELTRETVWYRAGLRLLEPDTDALASLSRTYGTTRDR
jgi:hypothetical protein